MDDKNMDDNKRSVELAKDLIISYFDSLSNKDMLNPTGFIEAIAVRSDDAVLLEHVKAWINILSSARDTLEDELNEE